MNAEWFERVGDIEAHVNLGKSLVQIPIKEKVIVQMVGYHPIDAIYSCGEVGSWVHDIICRRPHCRLTRIRIKMERKSMPTAEEEDEQLHQIQLLNDNMMFVMN